METYSRPSRSRLSHPAELTRATRVSRKTRIQPVVDAPLKTRSELSRNRIPTLAPSVNCRVLFVAQKSRHSQLVSMILANENMTVRAVSEIQADELQLAAGVPDLLILDGDTPGCDCLTTLAQLRINSATARVPVIFLTSSAESEGHRRELAPFGIHWILEKPIAALILPKLIRRTIKIASQHWLTGGARYQRAEVLAEYGQMSCGAVWKAIG